MKMDKMMLWSSPVADGAGEEPSITPFLLDDGRKHGMVIVLPGGGYTGLADHEGVPIAEKFNSLGFHAAVVKYRVVPHKYPEQAQDALRAVKIVRFNAEKWNVAPDKIAVLGFSAGGHLACSTGILFDRVDAANGDGADSVSARPDALILCYALLVDGKYGVEWCIKNLIGHTPSKEESNFFSWDKNLREDTPPTFLWHTAEDKCVPVQNSLIHSCALKEQNIPFELHVFPRGCHGLGLADGGEYPDICVWPTLAAKWLSLMGW